VRRLRRTRAACLRLDAGASHRLGYRSRGNGCGGDRVCKGLHAWSPPITAGPVRSTEVLIAQALHQTLQLQPARHRHCWTPAARRLLSVSGARRVKTSYHFDETLPLPVRQLRSSRQNLAAAAAVRPLTRVSCDERALRLQLVTSAPRRDQRAEADSCPRVNGVFAPPSAGSSRPPQRSTP
jgi:hypothetical protein